MCPKQPHNVATAVLCSSHSALSVPPEDVSSWRAVQGWTFGLGAVLPGGAYSKRPTSADGADGATHACPGGRGA